MWQIHRTDQKMEEKIRFLSDGHEIEGRLEKSSLQKSVVITHPHPLYGEDMHNNEPQLENMIMVSPPVAFIDFGPISDLDSLRLIVTGSRDDIAPPDLIKKSYAAWNAEAQFEVINGADHFYMGYLDKLEAVLAMYLEHRERSIN